MGCDIHAYAERKKPDGTWEAVDGPPDGFTKYHKDPDILRDDGFTEPRVSYCYHGRNYALFTILAGVRDYGEGIVPIDQPRGIPDDASPGYRREVEAYGGDGHSHSWLTLAELLDYSWSRPVPRSGWVSASVYLEWKGRGFQGDPLTWARESFGPKKLPSREAMEAWLAKNADKLPEGPADTGPIVFCGWESAYTFPEFQRTLHFLHTLHRDPSSVRLVFFFDN